MRSCVAASWLGENALPALVRAILPAAKNHTFKSLGALRGVYLWKLVQVIWVA